MRIAAWVRCLSLDEHRRLAESIGLATFNALSTSQQDHTIHSPWLRARNIYRHTVAASVSLSVVFPGGRKVGTAVQINPFPTDPYEPILWLSIFTTVGQPAQVRSVLYGRDTGASSRRHRAGLRGLFFFTKTYEHEHSKVVNHW